MKHAEGGCLCGAIRFRVTGAPRWSVICHCHSCRKASASPSVAWVTFDRDKFEVMRGRPRRFASSPGVVRTFCSDCGTPLTYASGKNPDTIDVTTLSLDDVSLFPPNAEVWLSDRVAWQAIDANRVRSPKDLGDASDGPSKHEPR